MSRQMILRLAVAAGLGYVSAIFAGIVWLAIR